MGVFACVCVARESVARVYLNPVRDCFSSCLSWPMHTIRSLPTGESQSSVPGFALPLLYLLCYSSAIPSSISSSSISYSSLFLYLLKSYPLPLSYPISYSTSSSSLTLLLSLSLLIPSPTLSPIPLLLLYLLISLIPSILITSPPPPPLSPTVACLTPHCIHFHAFSLLTLLRSTIILLFIYYSHSEKISMNL